MHNIDQKERCDLWQIYRMPRIENEQWDVRDI
jgi:hypothetical protein